VLGLEKRKYPEYLKGAGLEDYGEKNPS